MGLRQARDERHLADQLRRERLVPVRMLRIPGLTPAPPRASLKDQAELNTQLSQLLSRGVPLVEALDVTASCVSAKLKPKVRKMREMVASGSNFADACESVGSFDRVNVAVYRAAERSGDLAGAAKQLSINARRQLQVAGKAITLMIYPAIVLSLSVIVSAFMLTVIVPQIGEALSKTGAPLPWITTIVVAVGTFLREHWVWFGLGLLVLAVVLYFMRATLKVLLARFMRTVPLLRDVVLAQESARFFTVMAAMTRNGVTLADALGVAVGTLGHPTLRSQLTRLRVRLIEGGVLRQLIDEVTTLPLPTRRLLIAAERSGDLQSAFDTLAGDMAEEVDRRSQRLLAALEPLLIVFMFLMIGSLMLAIMVPLMRASQNIQ